MAKSINEKKIKESPCFKQKVENKWGVRGNTFQHPYVE
jgi:hypothetical protein